MIIAGIDPSLTNTAIVHGDGETHVVSCFKSNPLGPYVRGRIARIDRLVHAIDQHLERAGQVDVLLIEGYSYGSNTAGTALGEYGGILRWHLVDRAVAIYEVAPTTLKKFATGAGKGDKSVMCGQIAARWGVTFGTNDEYDAFALYRLGLVIAGIVEAETVPQREAADKVTAEKVKKPRKKRREPTVDNEPQSTLPFLR